MPSSGSPIMRRDKRRRATDVASESNESPAKGVKRTKTTNHKTYGSISSRTLRAPEDDNWKAFTEDESQAERTSQSLRLSDHSTGPNPSSGLPEGTIKQDFINHEPNMMFRDTGSTNAFNESSQQRIIDNALGNNAAPNNVPAASGTASEKQESSFPWSDSGQSLKASNSHILPDGGTDPNGSPKKNGIRDEIASAAENPPDEATATNIAQNVSSDGIIVSVPEKADKPAESPPRSSPIVKIPRHRRASINSYEAGQGSPPKQTAEKKTRGRPRKTADDEDMENGQRSDPFNSDDKHIGLPKEMCKPRPSRRRATEIVEPMDYSVVPEKAAKKRRKTADFDAITVDDSKRSHNSAQIETSEVTASVEKDETQPEMQLAADKFTSNASQEEGKERPPLQRRKTPKRPTVEPLSPAKAPELESKEDSPEKEMQQSPPKPSPDGSMSMPPPPLPPSSKKKKLGRSKTTIYEDHMATGASRKSPSLSQQQANRRSVLEEQTESSQNKRSKRRTILQDDEDDEDELAKEDPEDEIPAPKKRGRPAKAPPAKTAKSAKRVLPDSEDEEEDFHDAAEEGEEEIEEPPKKKRGRPAKAKAPAEAPKQDEPAKSAEPEKATTPSNDTPSLKDNDNSPTKAALEPKDPNREISNRTEEAPDSATKKPMTSTPPSKPNTPTPQKPTHSPIKSASSGGVGPQYRVGLSKTRRIPSLLKVIRPSKPTSTR